VFRTYPSGAVFFGHNVASEIQGLAGGGTARCGEGVHQFPSLIAYRAVAGDDVILSIGFQRLPGKGWLALPVSLSVLWTVIVPFCGAFGTVTLSVTIFDRLSGVFEGYRVLLAVLYITLRGCSLCHEVFTEKVYFQTITIRTNNQSQMGQITVQKNDGETGEAVTTPATFDIRAAENIRTPDGTCRPFLRGVRDGDALCHDFDRLSGVFEGYRVLLAVLHITLRGLSLLQSFGPSMRWLYPPPGGPLYGRPSLTPACGRGRPRARVLSARAQRAGFPKPAFVVRYTLCSAVLIAESQRLPIRL